MSKIKVLQMIGSLDIGGSQSFIMNLYRNIDREKVQFDFILDHPEQLYYKDEVEKLGGKVYFMPTFKGTNIRQVRKAWSDFFHSHPEYSVLHSHVRSYASLYLPIAKKNHVKTVIHSHSTSNGSGVAAFVKMILQYPLRYQADFFMGCSRQSGEWLFGKKVCNSNRYCVMPNVIDLTRYERNDTVRENYRKTLHAEDKYVYIHVGRLHEAKNHMFLLDLYHEIAKRRPDSVLWLVGDGELRQQIEARIRKLHLEDHVRLLGSRDDVPQLLQAADMFLFPSKWEGLPIAVIEAQATGLNCVISDAITTEVDITNFVKRCSLTDDINVWLTTVFSEFQTDTDENEKIKKAGFDVKTASNTLIDIYEMLGLS